MKRINLLGMKLKDRYTKESLILTERFFKKGAVHIILYLTTAVLLEADKNEEEKAWIESADATLWGDTEILEAAEITARGRYHEVKEKEFLKSFLRRMARGHKSILVLSDTEEHAQTLKEELFKMHDGITVTGTMAIQPDAESDQDSLINDINMIAPEVIMVRMPFSMQQKWLTQSRHYLNTGIWIGMPEDFSCVRKREMPVERMGKRILNVLFNRTVNKYKK